MKRKERFIIYCILLHELETAKLMTEYPDDRVYTMVDGVGCGGMCDILMAIFDTGNSGGSMEELGLKELRSLRPKFAGTWWFPRTVEGWQQRIELVKKCIKQTS